MLKEDASEFLRRICVICLEDTVLHPALPLLTWLTAAQAKDYTLGASHFNACLHIVHQLASVTVRDFLPAAPWSEGRTVGNFAAVDGVLRAAEAALVKCLLLRASFGGMTGDMAMLRGFAGLWTSR